MKYWIYLFIIFIFSCDPIPEESEKCDHEILIKNIGVENVRFNFEPINNALQELPCPFGVIESDSIRIDPSTLPVRKSKDTSRMSSIDLAISVDRMNSFLLSLSSIFLWIPI